jgi:hypothetical protein
MARGKANRDARMRERLVQESARIMAVEGIRDFSIAKRKAALQLNAPRTTNLPQNREIQAALQDYQRLFGGERQLTALQLLREAALEAMTFFAAFRPRLTGSVLDGTAGDQSAVDLHCFAETPEDVVFFLMDHDIPFDTQEKRFRFEDDYETIPVHHFVAGETPVTVAVFAGRGNHQPPKSPIDGRPMQRASRRDVEALIAEDASAVD